MKLNKTKIRWIIRQKRKVMATKDIAREMEVSTRHVQQVLKIYRETCVEIKKQPLQLNLKALSLVI